MKQLAKVQIVFFLGLFLLLPAVVLAQNGPASNFLYPFNEEVVTAQAYLVMDVQSGEVLLAKNAKLPWVPASLTKLVTAMVVLDRQPNFKSVVTMQKSDEIGGARLYTKAGITYYLGDLFYASLVASTNNTTRAIARSAGLSLADFVQAMNIKAQNLGATGTNFVEPTGMDSANSTTAEDYAKILRAALAYPKIQEAVTVGSYSFKALNNYKYKHTVKTTDQLLADEGLMVVGGKTGFLDQAGYNFAGEFKDVDGKNIIVILFGSKDHQSQFFETKNLAVWAWVNYKWTQTVPQPQVAGAFVGLKMPDNF